MRFQLFGEVRAEHDGVPVDLGRRQERCLLGLLLTEPGRVLPVGRIADLLWEGRPPAGARGAIQTYVGRLRSVLAPHGVRIATVAAGYRVDVPAEDIDLHRFRAMVTSARELVDPAERSRVLTAALELWRGPVLGDVATERLRAQVGAPAEELRLAAVEQCAEAALDCGDPSHAIALLGGAAELRPVRERSVGLLMAAYSAAGRTSEALDAYRRARRALVEELGLEPGPYLARQHQRVLRSGDRDPAPGSGTAAPTFRPFQLPPDLPDFVGRREAVKTLVATLSGDASGAFPAVVSVTGMPGTGKSALAVHVGHLLHAQYPDGQIYLDLAGDDVGTIDTHGALGRVLQALGFTQAALPVGVDERTAALRSLSADRRLLLVLDNAHGADHVEPLLPANPRCGVLITSRAQLGGLLAWPEVELAPLDVADGLEMLSRILGRQRVGAEPDAGLRVVELCAGLPLAIRIAGTRLAARPHQSLAWLATRLGGERTRLDELSVGGTALRTSFDVCYHGLDPQRQRALRLLALLEVPDFGGWLASATLDRTPREAEDLVDGLIEARLLGVAPAAAADLPRFRMHQLIRLYAREAALSVDGSAERDAALGRAYSACLALAERLDQGLRAHVKLVSSGRPRPPVPALSEVDDPAGVAAWFAAEHGTLVAAVHGCAALGWADLTWDLSLTLQRFLESHHHFRDWHEVATAGLSAARAGGDRRAESALLCSLGEAHAVQDEYAAADAAFREALTVAEECGDQRVRARALLGLSIVAEARGELEAAAAIAGTALDIVDERLDSGTAAEARMALGSIRYKQGDLAGAEAQYAPALAGFTATGDRMNQAILLVNMGTTYRAAGRWAEAERAFGRSAEICREIGFRNGEGFAYTALGVLLRQLGRNSGAEQALNAALAIVREYADRFTEVLILINLGELFRPSDVDRSRLHFTEAVALVAEAELPNYLADALCGLGETELAAGRPDDARQAWTRAACVLDPIDAARATALRARVAELTDRHGG